MHAATKAIAEAHGCDVHDGLCPGGDMGEPCMCEQFASIAMRIERERCIRIVCQYCANGNVPDDKGWHCLEIIQGHTVHEVACAAVRIRNLDMKD
jgi:hypothetical protein